MRLSTYSYHAAYHNKIHNSYLIHAYYSAYDDPIPSPKPPSTKKVKKKEEEEEGKKIN